MRHTHISAELNFVPKGSILVDGLNLLKTILNELKKKLAKKFKISMNETAAYTPYVVSISDEKTMQHVDRYDSIDFEQRLKDHPWSPVTETQVTSKKQKKKKPNPLLDQNKQQYPLK